MAASFLTNQFLIAMPGMADPNFAQTVTLVCEHNAQGALGIVINRPLAMTLGDVFAQLGLDATQSKVSGDPVLHGGPVQTDRGFVLHSPGPLCSSAPRCLLRSSPSRCCWPCSAASPGSLRRAS